MRIAIVGATGLVGQTFLKVLEEYNLPIIELACFASERSAGKSIQFNKQAIKVEVLDEHSFERGFDYALFSAGGSISAKYAPIAAQAGCIVVDNSSQWRMDPTVPLVVPEINLDHITAEHGIIANPNCSTIQSVLPLNALKPWGLKRVVYTTYQAVSGSGQKGVDDLKRNLEDLPSTFYPKNILHNVIPQIDVFLASGDTKEEQKMIDETRKILDLPILALSATCVRVPVLNGHSVAINVELEIAFEIQDILDALRKQTGLKLMIEDYPTPLDVSGQDEVYVGRVRRDTSLVNGLHLWVVADNIRKGAAANAVQIVQKHWEARHGL